VDTAGALQALPFSIFRPLFCGFFVPPRYLCVLFLKSAHGNEDRIEWRPCVGHGLHEV